MDMQFINPIRFTIYCQNATRFNISELKTDLVIPPYYYFIIFDPKDKQLKLLTFENRDDLHFCHEAQTLVEINRFSQKLQKWTLQPVFPKKYQNFHGCQMILGAFASGINLLRFNMPKIKPESRSPDGPLAYIFDDISQHLNFSVKFLSCKEGDCRDREIVSYIYNVIHVVTLDGYAIDYLMNVKWRNVMLNIQCTLVFTTLLIF
jgi:hypothetical protein